MILLAVALTAGQAGAGQKTWANIGTDYNTGGNWTGGLPGTGDYASFPNQAVTNQPNLSAGITNQQVAFGGSGWILSSSGGAKLTLTSTGNGTAGGTGSALNGGTYNNTISAAIVLGAASGSTQRIYIGNLTSARLTISGNISEATGPVTVAVEDSYVSAIQLSGSNTFTGGLKSENGPVLELGSSSAVPAAGTFTFGRSNGSNNGGVLRSSDNSLKRISAPFVLYAAPATDRLTIGGVSGGGGQHGSIVFGGTGTLSGDTAILVPSADGTDVSAAAFEGNIGESGGSRGLTLIGGHNNQGYRGYTFLLGTNTYSGQTVLFASHAANPVAMGNLGGACVINSLADAGTACSLGQPTGDNAVIALSMGTQAAAASFWPDGTLRYIGTGHSSSRPFQFGTNLATNGNAACYLRLDASGTGALNLNGNMTIADNTGTTTRVVMFTGISTNDNTFGGVIPATPTQTSALTKNGRGTWVLSGANTFNGALTTDSGRLILDYANSTTIVPTNTALTLGGGTLELRGKSSGASAQTIGTVTTTASTGPSAIRVNQDGGTGTALISGALTRNVNSVLLFDLSGSAGSSATVGTSLITPNGGILIRDSAGRVDYAKNTGADTAIFALTAATDLPANANNSAVDYRLTGSQTVTGTAMRVRTLRIAPSSAGQSLTLSPATPTANFQVAAGGGILFAGGYDFTINQTGTGAIADGTAVDNDAVIHHFGAGKLTLAVKLAGNSNSVANANAIVGLFGTGLIDWTTRCNGGGDILLGGVTVRNSGSGGALLDTTATGAGAGNVVLTGGAVLELTDTDCTRNMGTAAGAIQWTGDGGFSAYGAARAVRLNNGVASITWPNLWSASQFVPANNALILGSPYSDNTVDFQNGLFFGCQQRVVRVLDGVSPANMDAKLSGALTGRYGGGLVKEGPGTLEITGTNNTYEGDTWVREGTLRVSNGGGEGTGSGRVTVYAGAAISGTGTVNRLTFQSGGVLKPYTIGGVLSAIRVTGTADLSSGTLDLSGAGSLSGGDQTLVRCGSRNGVFAAVTGLPGGCSIQYTDTAVVLKNASGTVLMVQ
jgi:autotransporter-associated beta strand protein